MAPSKCSIAFSLLSLCLLFNLSLSDLPPAATVDPSTACNATTDPKSCKSDLPQHSSGNLYYYGRFSLARSLSNSEKFLNLVNHYLSRRSTLLPTAILALEDCQLLSELNIDFLRSAGGALNSTNNLLDPQVDQVQTLLSALLTNQQTCYDGLQATASAWSVNNGLAVPITNSTKLYSVSLSFFNKAWVRDRKFKSHRGFSPSKLPKRRGLLFQEAEVGRDGGLPLSMSSKVLEKRSRCRSLLQSATDTVTVKGIAAVSQDWSRDFTDVSSAVAAAPNNLDGSSGYYLIYVAAGVYEEYVVIPDKRKI